ncbi:DUF2238 domain-containing protein [Halobacteria archaeon AArc-curdl1]|uniref:DUF2238 domain-containing protein n=1 Tax=Natronosalvus hydrolyticus TaxID=2979988 RepID=A0AAP3E651_9EURY|nr:DUF2238 domain-containing protein [Halobacteria archaeon AArc-curdl1]
MTLLPRPSVRNQRRLTRGMQLLLVGIIVYGVLYSQPKAITNGSLALLITFAPAILERNYRVPLDPWLGLWITLAVFLHTMGSAGLYGAIGWWDHLTHAMSASVVAGIGYTFARAIHLHHEDIHIPSRFAFVFILIFVMAFGVIWELFEFGLDVAAEGTGIQMPLSQHGIDDTVRDMMFNTLGALVVATFGQVHLSGVAESVLESLGAPEQ